MPVESRSATEWLVDTIIGSHDFNVRGYSFVKGLGVGKYITSDVFTVGGYSWKMRFFPGGIEDEDYVSIYLSLESDAKAVTAFFEATLLDLSGIKKHVVRKCDPCTFGEKIKDWGLKKFVKRTDLENFGYLKDDYLHFCGRVGVMQSQEHYLLSLTPSNMNQHFGRLLESGEGADVNCKVNGEIFSAHKVVLAARSPVFKALFFGSLKDQAQTITIEEMEAPVFKALLHFIYWDKLPDLDEKVTSKQTSFVMHLLTAADRYDLDRLKLLCAAKLVKDIATDTICTTLTLAERHNCLPLKAACLKYVVRIEKFQDVMNRDDFKNLKETFPHLYVELLEHIAGINKCTTAAKKMRTR